MTKKESKVENEQKGFIRRPKKKKKKVPKFGYEDKPKW